MKSPDSAPPSQKPPPTPSGASPSKCPKAHTHLAALQLGTAPDATLPTPQPPPLASGAPTLAIPTEPEETPNELHRPTQSRRLHGRQYRHPTRQSPMVEKLRPPLEPSRTRPQPRSPAQRVQQSHTRSKETDPALIGTETASLRMNFGHRKKKNEGTQSFGHA